MNDKNASVLESVRAVTYSAANFDASVQAMQTCLNYKIVGAGEISKPLASLWNAPAVAGKRYSVLAPESGESFYVRFIESPVTPGYEALKTYGWNATEFLVQDVYALAKELETSPYTIIGGPRDLMENGAAIALQVRGPSDEVFYFTELNGRNFQKFYGVANCKVDRAFITILGVKDHAAAVDHYGSAAVSTTKIRTFGIRVLANAHGLNPLTTEFKISSAICKEPYRIELDGYPGTARARPCLPNHLPPGMCMVTITTTSIKDLPLVKTSLQQTGLEQLPYSACQLAMAEGVCDELVELLEIHP